MSRIEDLIDCLHEKDVEITVNELIPVLLEQQKHIEELENKINNITKQVQRNSSITGLYQKYGG